MKIPIPLRNPDGSYTTEPHGLAVDGDGANGQSSAPVYAPKGFTPEPLDFLANAGGPGNWYGVVTNSGKAIGTPILQKAGDPAPGAYVSATSYERPGFSRADPKRYLDANTVFYIVLPSHWRAEAIGVVLGCKARVTDTKTGKALDAMVGDFGPQRKCDEASIAVCRYFGVPSSPKNGGTDEERFVFQFWPGIAAPGYSLIPAS